MIDDCNELILNFTILELLYVLLSFCNKVVPLQISPSISQHLCVAFLFKKNKISICESCQGNPDYNMIWKMRAKLVNFQIGLTCSGAVCWKVNGLTAIYCSAIYIRTYIYIYTYTITGCSELSVQHKNSFKRNFSRNTPFSKSVLVIGDNLILCEFKPFVEICLQSRPLPRRFPRSRNPILQNTRSLNRAFAGMAINGGCSGTLLFL